MFRYLARRNRTVYALVALGLLLRSLVAPGLMFVADLTNDRGFAFVLCPGQNKHLNLDLLEPSAGSHHHHGSVELDPNHDSNAYDSTGVVTQTLDPGCPLWVGSAAACTTTIDAYVFDPEPETLLRAHLENFPPDRTKHAALARAPPFFG